MVVRDRAGWDPEQYLNSMRAAFLVPKEAMNQGWLGQTGARTITACKPIYVDNPLQTLLLQKRSPLGPGYQCWEGEEHTLGMKSAYSASTPATWDLSLPSAVWYLTLNRGEVPAHTRLWIKQLPLHAHVLPR